jgi:RimJ/RimL family protein N-acetyltransferase
MDQGEASADEAVLETDRLVLRRWRVADAVVQRELWTERDPRVPPHRRIGPDGRPTLAELEDWIRRADQTGTLGLLAAERKGTGDVIGYGGLIPNVHGQDGEPELAYEFLRKVWGQGYATEASRAVISWAEASGLLRLWATVRDWNTASSRVLAKLGFVETGRVEPDRIHGDSVFYAKTL